MVFKQSVGMSDHLALLMGGFVTLSFLAGTFISMFIIDRLGRRPVSRNLSSNGKIQNTDVSFPAYVIWPSLRIYWNGHYGHLDVHDIFLRRCCRYFWHFLLQFQLVSPSDHLLLGGWMS